MTKQPQMASLVMKWLYIFLILALHTKSEPFPESAWKNINFDTHNLTLASNGLKWPQAASIGLQWPHFFSPFWPQKYAHENRGVKRASHIKYELNLWSRTPSNRLLNDKMAPVFMSIFLRSRLRIKLRSLDANGGCLRPFEAEVKLWVSKFIFWDSY